MASLQPCSLLTPTSSQRTPASSKAFSAKPSHFLSHARRSHRFQVSCNGGADKKPTVEGKVDRRNMLLGLGGLYGAANLVSDPQQAAANPIEAPSFSKGACGKAYDVATGNLLDVNCCPPASDTFVDYKLPPVHKMRIRPAAHKVTKEYLAKFEEGIRRMKELDKTDPSDPRGFMQQANIHCAYCNGAHDQLNYPNLDIQVHNSWLFFPFHRWYLYFYERIIGKLIDDPTFVLPFWNWDNPKGMQMPKIFDNERSTLYNTNRNPANRPPKIMDLSFSGATDDLQIVANNLTAMYTEMVRGVNTTLDFMGAKYVAGDPPSPGMGSSERGSHIAAHVFVGTTSGYREDMGNFYSAGRDTLFYCHHANVDRMWSIWKNLKTDVPKDITDPDYLNAAFMFYDENKQLVRVKVADCIDHGRMGYDFEKVDTPWLNYRPPRKEGKVKIQNITSDAPKVESVLPLNLKKTARVLVSKSAKGKADEVLALENIEYDTTKFVKFDIFVNDEDDNPEEVDRAEYAGTFASVPHKNKDKKKGVSNINLRLTELYEDIDVADDDKIVITIIPRSSGEDITIGGIKIIPSPPRSG